MRRTLIALALVLALPAGTVLAQTFGAVLTGSQEVPPTTSPGFGNATVSFTDATHTNINVTITVTNLGSPISNFHIHGPKGPAGTNANVANGPAAAIRKSSPGVAASTGNRREIRA